MYIYNVGRPHQRLPMVDERTLTRRLLGGSYREGDDGGEQQPPSGSSTPGRKVTTSTLSSTKTMGNSTVSEGKGGWERRREGEREYSQFYTFLSWLT